MGTRTSSADQHRRGFRRIVYSLILLVIVPTALLLAVGIVMLSLWRAELNLLFGILVVTLVLCLVTGAVLALVFLRKEARLSQLQLDFVSKVSHELRTPLTSIRMFAEMLQGEGARDVEQNRICLEVLQRETLRLSERIERLLDWGRMEAGRHTFQPEPASVETIVADALTSFRGAILGRERQVHTTIEPELPRLFVDRAAISDALLNLLSNADKYSQDDAAEIRIAATQDHRAIRLAVTDRGIGIPKGEHRRIFQKFYRVDERLSRAVEGTGLGLAIVQHVALAHHGRVEVDSTVGKGSTFTMVLPKPRPPVTETDDAIAAHGAPAAG